MSSSTRGSEQALVESHLLGHPRTEVGQLLPVVTGCFVARWRPIWRHYINEIGNSACMTHIQVLIVATIAWIIWIPASSLGRLVSEGRGNISILPVFPGAPLAAWGLTYVVPAGGAVVIGLVHFALMIWMLCSIAKSRHTLKSKGAWPPRSKDAL